MGAAAVAVGVDESRLGTIGILVAISLVTVDETPASAAAGGSCGEAEIAALHCFC